MISLILELIVYFMVFLVILNIIVVGLRYLIYQIKHIFIKPIIKWRRVNEE